MEYSEMTANVVVAFYSTYGHVHRMALAVVEGAESVPDTTVRLRRIAELEEARKALSAQDAYVRHSRHRPTFPWSRMTTCAGLTALLGGRRPAMAT
jgi:hypothetical protein